MPPVSSSRTVLVVDDNDGIRQMLRTALRTLNFDVRIAANGAQALDLFTRDAIDLVLLDVQMPIMDGPQLLTALQKIRPDVRCCFMSGNSGAYTKEELLQRGAACVIQKPFRLADLRRALETAMGNSRAGGVGGADLDGAGGRAS
jgi:CheY-like chemotaxis protein